MTTDEEPEEAAEEEDHDGALLNFNDLVDHVLQEEDKYARNNLSREDRGLEPQLRSLVVDIPIVSFPDSSDPLAQIQREGDVFQDDDDLSDLVIEVGNLLN